MRHFKKLSILLIVLAGLLPLRAQAITPVAFPPFHVTDPYTGMPLVGGLVWSYQAGTSSASTTYKDPAFSVANTPPIVLDFDGNTTIYINQPTKLVVEGPPPVGQTHGAVLFTFDNLEAAPYNSYVTVGSTVPPTPATGQISFYCIGTTLYIIDSMGAITAPATAQSIQQQTYSAAAGGGTGDAITATPTPSLTSLVDKTRLWIWAPAANTTTIPTFSPNGLIAKTIVKGSNTPLVAGDIPGANSVLLIEYNATLDKWVLVNPVYPFGYPPALPGVPLKISTTTITAAATTTIGIGAYSFTISPATVSAGAVYSNNTQTFTVTGSIRNGTTLSTIGSGAPLSTGTLTLVSGTGPATIAFSAEVLAAGTHYKLYLNLVQNTSAGFVKMQFNADTGNNYSWGALVGGIGSAASGGGQATVAYLPITFYSSGYDAGIGYSCQGKYDITALAGSSTAVGATFAGYYQDSGNGFLSITTGGQYTGAAALSSLTIFTSAGTLSGTATLYVVP